MDNCIDCGRILRDLVCGRCRQIYLAKITEETFCHFCGRQELRRNRSDVRWVCNFCLYNYFDMSRYNPRYESSIQEFLDSYEKECPDCASRMQYFRQTQEVICRNCGLVYDGAIYTGI